jgi:hypothetical protein
MRFIVSKRKRQVRWPRVNDVSDGLCVDTEVFPVQSQREEKKQVDEFH